MDNRYNIEDNSYVIESPIENEQQFRTDLYPYNIEEGDYLTLYVLYNNNQYDAGEAYYDIDKYIYTYKNKAYTCDNIDECITVINNTYYDIINSVISVSPTSEYEEDEDFSDDDSIDDFENN